MKRITQEPGGRRYVGDDWLQMQETTLNLTEDFFKQYGSFVINGCKYSESEKTITSGVVLLNGKACLFDGDNNATAPYYVRQTVETENVAYKVGNNVGYTTYLAKKCAEKDEGAFRLDNAPRFEDMLKPANAINADTVDGKHATRFLDRESGTYSNMEAGVSIGVVPATVGGSAVGLFCRNASNVALAGIGGMFNNGVLQLMYIGWGAEPWNSVNNLHVSDSAIRYKNNKVWHEGNMGSGSGLNADIIDGIQGHDIMAFKGTFTSNVDANTLLEVGIYGLHLGNGTNNTNFPKNDMYGIFLVTSNGTFIVHTATEYSTNTTWIRTHYLNDFTEWKNIADGGAAATAAKLATARTLWGQPFNGTNDVSGNMFNVGDINMLNGTRYGQGIIELFHTTPAIDFHYNNSSADYTSRIIEYQSGRLSIPGNLNIGSTGDSSYKLYVGGGDVKLAGNVTIDNDIATNGRFNLTNAGKSAITSPYQIYFYPNGAATSPESSAFVIASSAIFPGSTNVVDIGLSGHRFKNGWFAGNITIDGAFYDASDERLKSNIEVVDTSAIEKVEFKQYIKNGKKEVGVIAQQVQQYMPDAVVADGSEEAYLSVNYNSILSAKCALYEKKIVGLEERLKKLEGMLNG